MKKHKMLQDAQITNETLKDDTQVLRRAILNSKVKQKALKDQLEEMKSQNLELITKVQRLHL
jgi:hypothetical protein